LKFGLWKNYFYHFYFNLINLIKYYLKFILNLIKIKTINHHYLEFLGN